jgi:hypothetical protein
VILGMDIRSANVGNSEEFGLHVVSGRPYTAKVNTSQDGLDIRQLY